MMGFYHSFIEWMNLFEEMKEFDLKEAIYKVIVVYIVLLSLFYHIKAQSLIWSWFSDPNVWLSFCLLI